MKFPTSPNMKPGSGTGAPCSGERGGEIVEFAFVITALAALIFGIISFARAYNIYQTITRAAREGARMASLPSSVYDGNSFTDGATIYTNPDSPVFTSYIAPALRAANLNTSACAGADATDCIADYNEEIGWMAPSGTSDNQCGITISFTYPYQLAIPFLSQGIGTIDLSTKVQMRRQDQPVPGSTTCP